MKKAVVGYLTFSGEESFHEVSLPTELKEFQGQVVIPRAELERTMTEDEKFHRLMNSKAESARRNLLQSTLSQQAPHGLEHWVNQTGEHKEPPTPEVIEDVLQKLDAEGFGPPKTIGDLLQEKIEESVRQLTEELESDPVYQALASMPPPTRWQKLKYRARYYLLLKWFPWRVVHRDRLGEW